jgi:predicted phosphodiesterase
MSDPDTKSRKSKRLSKTHDAIEKQTHIAKHVLGHVHKNQPHRYAKMHSLNCGDPTCHMCGNPRKFFKERTLQEKKFIEGNKYTQNDCTDSE